MPPAAQWRGFLQHFLSSPKRRWKHAGEMNWHSDLNLLRTSRLYSAITCYKRALYQASSSRTFEIEYHIIEAYYLGRKYQEAIDFYETHSLSQVPLTFPACKKNSS